MNLLLGTLVGLWLALLEGLDAAPERVLVLVGAGGGGVAPLPLARGVGRIPKVALFHGCDEVFVVAASRESRGYVAFGRATPLLEGGEGDERVPDLGRELRTNLSSAKERKRTRCRRSLPSPGERHAG